MARAKAGTGFILVVGLIAGAAAAVRASDDAPPVGRAHAALNDAIEAQRRGQYENAATLLQQVSNDQAGLSAVEQQELARLLKENTTALDARHEGAQQLRLAVNAMRTNRQAEAIDLLKKVAVNEQYLKEKDRSTFLLVSAGMNLPAAPPEPALAPVPEVKPVAPSAPEVKPIATPAVAPAPPPAPEVKPQVAPTPVPALAPPPEVKPVAPPALAPVLAPAPIPEVKPAGPPLPMPAPATEVKPVAPPAPEVKPVAAPVAAAAPPPAPAPEVKPQETPAPAPAPMPQLKPITSPTPATAAAPDVKTGVQARSLVRQARGHLIQGDFDQAEKEAISAAALNAEFAKNEDSPVKVLDDLARARADAVALLKASRAALQHKDFDKAEEYAHLSEKASTTWNLTLFGDTPAKALKDIQAARASKPTAEVKKPDAPKATAEVKKPDAPKPDAPKPMVVPLPDTAEATKPDAPKPDAPKPTVVQAAAKQETNKTDAAPTVVQASKPADDDVKPAAPAANTAKNTEEARPLLARARKAIEAGDFVEAHKLIDQARALKPDLQWFEDNPDKLQIEAARAEARSKAPAGGASKDAPATPDARAQAVALLKQGRIQLNDGKLDDAAQTVSQLRAVTGVSWGLFEDSPEKLRQDVDAARLKHDQEESVRLLAEARKLMQEGAYDDAERAAYRAQKLHGSYSVWDFGDRPSKVLADLESARLQSKGAPDKPAPAVAANKVVEDKGSAVKPTAKPAVTPYAQAATTQPRPTPPPAPAVTTAANPPAPVVTTVSNPPSAAGPAVTTAAYPSAPAVDPNKAKAVQLLAEAGRLEQDDKLLEARQKINEAAKLNAKFGANEESPDEALQRCASLARRETARLMTLATDGVNYGAEEPLKRYATAEQHLLQARELAVGFGQDTQPVEAKLTWVHQVRAIVLKQPDPDASAVATTKQVDGPILPPPPPAAPAAVRASSQVDGPPLPPPAVAAMVKAPPAGSPPAAPAPLTPTVTGAPPLLTTALTPAQKLDMARVELNRGSTATARKLAEEVYATHAEARPAAEVMLRSIDAEEFAQQCRQDQKTFDAAVRSFNRRDYANASRLISTIDVRRLDPPRAGHLHEMMQTAQMQPGAGPVQVASVGGTGVGAKETSPGPEPTSAHGPDAPGTAHVSDAAGTNLLKSTEAMRQVKFQQLRQDGLKVQSAAQEKVSAGQTEAAVDLLEQYLARLDNEMLDPAQMSLLRRPVESRLQKFKILKIEDDLRTASNSSKEAHDKHLHDKMTAQRNKEQNVKELMNQFNTCFKEGKYADAERAAMQAHELDPDDTAATAAVTMAKLQKNMTDYKKLKENKENFVLKELNETENEGPPATMQNPLVIDPEIERRTRGRLKDGMYPQMKTEKEREIERKLMTPVTLNFTDTPLKQVIADVRAFQSVNIFVDQPALDREGVSMDHPVSVTLDNVSLKSALNLILKQVHLTYIIKDEVLQITSEGEARGKMQRVTYQVADLVIAIPNSTGALPNVTGGSSTPTSYVPTPVTGPYSLGSSGSPTGSPTGSPFATDAASGSANKGPSATREEELIRLITNTVDPRSWSDMGGPGTIDYHPLTMGLVVNQTPDIQEQIVDLLNSLRRLQDQEVALEVRFISISDDFFERIGIDFSMNILTSKENAKFQPQLTSGIFQPAGQINSFQPNNFVSGVSGPGQLTSDLNIPIRPQTFINTVPAYGGYVPGFSLGLAFLSEIQVYLFMEAVQGDNRVNVMQAPRLTAFNGQTATLNVQDSQSFVTNVNVQIGPNGNPIFQPVVTNSGSSVSLTIQPVISADRRFVRLNFGAPQVQQGGVVGQVQNQNNAAGGVTLTNLVPGTVATFPVVVPVFSGSTLQDPTAQVVFTQLIQQPVVNTINITTTVSVPDGGTVVMGGLKRLSESRSEYGPPILSKIPYINRLFKNVGYGRSAESLLIMVTPRIIIQEEEEERQTGFHIGEGGAGP